MRLFGLIFDNFGLKVLALVMAWAVWFMTRESLTEERVIWMNIEVVVIQGEDQVVASATNRAVNITVTGTARAVADLEKLANPVAVLQVKAEHFPPSGQWETTETFKLRDLKLPDLFDSSELRAKTMDPRRIEVRIDRIEVRDFPVEAPPIPAMPGTDVRIIQTTPTATVRGTLKDLAALNSSIQTSINRDSLVSLMNAMGDDHTIEDRINLDIAPVQQGIFKLVELVEPERLSAKVEISNVKTEKFTVPVYIHFTQPTTGDTGRRTLRFSPTNAIENTDLEWVDGEGGDPPTMNLVLVGSPLSIKKVDRATLIAFVLADEMPADETVSRLPVHVIGLPVGVEPENDIFLHVQIDQ